MKILPLNAWHGTRAYELRDFLQSQLDTTDIFCLQETNGENIEQIVSGLFGDANFSFAHVTKITDTDRHYSLHTFVKKPLQIIQHKTLFDENDAETGQALAVKTGTESGAVLTVVNVHGIPFLIDDKLDTKGRIRQTETIINWNKESGLPSVICGDFNLLPKTESVKKFTRAGYQNLVADYDIPTTRNRLAWEKHPDNIQLFADYTFVSPGVEVTDFTVPDNEVSDHLPMIVDIIL